METDKMDNNWLSFDAFEVAEAIQNFNTVRLASMAREASDTIYNWLCNSTNNLPITDKDFHEYLRKTLIAPADGYNHFKCMSISKPSNFFAIQLYSTDLRGNRQTYTSTFLPTEFVDEKFWQRKAIVALRNYRGGLRAAIFKAQEKLDLLPDSVITKNLGNINLND